MEKRKNIAYKLSHMSTLIDRLYEELKEQLPEELAEQLPNPPAFGDLDLEVIKEAAYTFA